MWIIARSRAPKHPAPRAVRSVNRLATVFPKFFYFFITQSAAAFFFCASRANLTAEANGERRKCTNDVRFGSEAGICVATSDVRFAPEPDPNAAHSLDA